MLNRNYYKANKTNTGSSIQVNYNLDKDAKGSIRDGSFMFRIQKQNGWNAEKEVGSFKDGENVVVKMSMFEAAEIKHVLEHRAGEFKFYHSGNTANTNGKVSYFKLEDKKTPGKFFEGFSFSITKKVGDQETILKSSLSLSEGADMVAYITYAQNKIFAALEAANDAWYKENAGKNPGKGKPAGKTTPAPAETPVDDITPPEGVDDVPF